MLSYVVRLAQDFQRNHGFWPNMLYLSPEHFSHWQGEFEASADFEQLLRRLSLDVTLSVDALHPHVAWLPPHCHYRTAV